MRPCHRYRILLLALAAGAVASCAANPPRRDETPAILEIRDEYLRTNPTGRFNAVIARGEVAVGMGYYDLLAAWGHPDGVEKSKDGDERWYYVLRDDNESDWVRYDFLFTEHAVVEWEASRHVASGFARSNDDPRGVARRVPPAPAGALGESARKGGVGTSYR